LLRHRQLNALIESRSLIVTRCLDVTRFTAGFDIDNSGVNDIAVCGIACARGRGAAGIHPDDTAAQMRGLAFSPDERKCDATTPLLADCRSARMRGGAAHDVFFSRYSLHGHTKEAPAVAPDLCEC
jgi:hypothetical protein